MRQRLMMMMMNRDSARAAGLLIAGPASSLVSGECRRPVTDAVLIGACGGEYVQGHPLSGSCWVRAAAGAADRAL
jgi:hypothetical protein